MRDALDRGAGFARADFRRPSDGTTPLMAAAWHGADGDVARLLGSGADPRVVDARGNDAAALAHARGHHGTRNLLLAAQLERSSALGSGSRRRSEVDFGTDADVRGAPDDDDACVGLPLDDFVYDVYAYDARADDGDAGDRRPPSPKDAWAPESLAAFPSMGDLSAGGASTQLAPPAPAPPPGDGASADDDDDDDDDALSTRCVVSPHPDGRARTLANRAAAAAAHRFAIDSGSSPLMSMGASPMARSVAARSTSRDRKAASKRRARSVDAALSFSARSRALRSDRASRLYWAWLCQRLRFWPLRKA